MKRNAGSDPDTGRLTQRDPGHNAEVTRSRITVEHANGRIKQYRIIRPGRTTAPQTSSTTSSTWSPEWSTSSMVGTGSSSPRTPTRWSDWMPGEPADPGAARSRPCQSMKNGSTARCGEAAHILPGSRRFGAGPADAISGVAHPERLNSARPSIKNSKLRN